MNLYARVEISYVKFSHNQHVENGKQRFTWIGELYNVGEYIEIRIKRNGIEENDSIMKHLVS